jgi:imidazolonepropionase-like amidohydrolase
MQLLPLRDAADARKTVDYCADVGVTSFKAYMYITRAELSATIEEAHKRGIKVTGHLCSIGFREAAAIGIDNLQGAITYMAARARASDKTDPDALEQLKREEQFEYDFVKAGGHLMAGVDPTGNGGAMAGFGDLRNLELLVEAEFTPVEAVKIATLNGARWLGVDKVGTIAVGKQADLVLIQGNPTAKISDVRNVKIVFKDGVGYDPVKLIQSVAGAAGLH